MKTKSKRRPPQLASSVSQGRRKPQVDLRARPRPSSRTACAIEVHSSLTSQQTIRPAGQRQRDGERGVAGEGADLEVALRAEQPDEHLHQRPCSAPICMPAIGSVAVRRAARAAPRFRAPRARRRSRRSSSAERARQAMARGGTAGRPDCASRRRTGSPASSGTAEVGHFRPAPACRPERGRSRRRGCGSGTG